MEKRFKKWAIVAQVMTLISFLALIGISVFNIFVAPGWLTLDAQRMYLINTVVANSGLDFALFGQVLTSVLVAKDVILAVVIFLLELILFFFIGSMRRHFKGYIKLTFASIVMVVLAALAGANIWLVTYLVSYVPFIFYQSLIFAAIIFIQLIIFIVYVIQYVRFCPLKLKEAFSKESLLRLSKNTIKNSTIFVFILVGLTAILGFGAYQLVLFIIPQLSLAQLFQTNYYFNILDIFGNNISPLLTSVIQSIRIEEWFFSIQNGIITFDISSIDTRIQQMITSYVTTTFNTLIQPVLIILAYYVGVNIVNFIYKKLSFKNDVILILLAIGVYFKPLYVPNINFILFTILDIFIVIAVTIYVIIRIDDVFFNGHFIDMAITWVTKVFKQVKTFFQTKQAEWKKARKDNPDIIKKMKQSVETHLHLPGNEKKPEEPKTKTPKKKTTSKKTTPKKDSDQNPKDK